ncbi:unnamed protein product (macronuclear) [Paramecium tetraurelia]|uniref:Transmembrane protein n=1 Tax=Paramecium tetraurelia TaxID=5888 RepID=A0CJH9_PARTE|nr:uncharacterized protein GSPATT00000657001 [Paramecium tetraurelia]CAK70946.1 unnamed protein product [Paramecium tetraurelia]|eukprot:XP_001438343.1 hypothetical protein (macronuclear) [Paramecium tetraurelia strain d4-2]
MNACRIGQKWIQQKSVVFKIGITKSLKILLQIFKVYSYIDYKKSNPRPKNNISQFLKEMRCLNQEFFMQIIIDAKFLLGIGVGFFVASFLMLPKIQNHQGNGSNPKLKLSSKSIPSTLDLKQVYLKKSDKSKQFKERGSTFQLQKTGLKNNKNDFLEEDEIRKRVKMEYHQFEPKFDETFIEVKSINTSSDFESPQQLRIECTTLLPINENFVSQQDDHYFTQNDKGSKEIEKDIQALANIQESPVVNNNCFKNDELNVKQVFQNRNQDLIRND